MWSIITVTYNSVAHLHDHWEQLSDSLQQDGVEWIVVDNASSDESAALAGDLGARVVRLRENIGFGAANNVGAVEARGDLLLFANPDLEVDVADLPRLEEALAQEKGIVAPQLVGEDGTPQPNGRGWPYLMRKMQNRLNLGELGDSYLYYAGDDQTLTVPWVTGAAVACEKTIFAAVGGWDRRYFLYNEDVALGLATISHGMSVRVLGDVRWMHAWEHAPAKLKWGPMRRELRSTLTFYEHHPLFLVPPIGGLREWVGRRVDRRYGTVTQEA